MRVFTNEISVLIILSGGCFVLASRAETFGVAYIEALATGVPVIATKCGGPEIFVHEDNGLMIPVDDLDALVNAMEYMYKNIKVFDREKVSSEIKDKFSPKYVSKKLVEVYEEVLKKEFEGKEI